MEINSIVNVRGFAVHLTMLEEKLKCESGNLIPEDIRKYILDIEPKLSLFKTFPELVDYIIRTSETLESELEVLFAIAIANCMYLALGCERLSLTHYYILYLNISREAANRIATFIQSSFDEGMSLSTINSAGLTLPEKKFAAFIFGQLGGNIQYQDKYDSPSEGINMVSDSTSTVQ